MKRQYIVAALPALAFKAMGCNAIIDIDKTYREVDSFSTSSSSSGAGGAGDVGGAGGAGSGGGGGEGGAPPTLPWLKSFGSAGSQFLHGLKLDAENNILVSGCFQNKIDLGGGPLESAGDYDFFIGKLDPAGNHIWSKRLGDALDNCGVGGVDVDPQGNIIVGGSFKGTVDFGGGVLASAGGTDMFLAKLSPTGDHVWSKRWGDAEPQGTAIAVDAEGNIFVTGGFKGAMDLGGGTFVVAKGDEDDVFLGRFSSMGDHMWSKAFPAIGQNISVSLGVDAKGDVVILAHTSGSIDMGGGALPMTGSAGAVVAKYTSGGDHVWSKLFDGSGEAHPKKLALGPGGEVYLTGRLYGEVNFGGGPVSTGQGAFFAKLSESGVHAHSIVAPNIFEMLGFAVDPQGNVVAGGVQYYPWYTDLGGSALDKPIVFVKLDPGLKHVSSISLGEGDAGDTEHAGIMAIDADSEGAAVIGGFFNKSIALGADEVETAGIYDAFLAKLPP